MPSRTGSSVAAAECAIDAEIRTHMWDGSGGSDKTVFDDYQRTTIPEGGTWNFTVSYSGENVENITSLITFEISVDGAFPIYADPETGTWTTTPDGYPILRWQEED